AGPREPIRDVGVEALQAAASPGAADAELEGCAAIASLRTACELATNPALLVVRCGEACSECWLLPRGRAPALDSAGRLEARHPSDKMRAREVVRRRERLAVDGVRLLLRHRRRTERTADCHAVEGARLTPELTCNEVSVSLSVHGASDSACAATAGCS